MNEKEALEGSIEKWTGIVNGEGSDDSYTNCPLCEKYRVVTEIKGTDHSKVRCFGCPVKISTKQHACEGSPYVEASQYDYPEDLEELEEAEWAAQAELDFLISLRW